MKTQKITSIAILALMCGPLNSHAQDVTAVNWGGDYAGSNQNFTNLTVFSNTVPIMSPNANYSGSSATFYGGAETNVSGGFSQNSDRQTNETGIVPYGGSDFIQFSWTGTPTESTQGILLWQKADFLGGAATSKVVFDQASNLYYSAPSPYVIPTRFVVEDGSTYYVSNLTFDSTTTLTDPDNSTTWAAFSPQTNLIFDSADASFSQHTFSDIEAVGYYFDSEDFGFFSFNYEVNGFSSQAESVPEPSCYFLIAMGVVAFSVSRNRGRALR